ANLAPASSAPVRSSASTSTSMVSVFAIIPCPEERRSRGAQKGRGEIMCTGLSEISNRAMQLISLTAAAMVDRRALPPCSSALLVILSILLSCRLCDFGHGGTASGRRAIDGFLAHFTLTHRR